MWPEYFSEARPNSIPIFSLKDKNRGSNLQEKKRRFGRRFKYRSSGGIAHQSERKRPAWLKFLSLERIYRLPNFWLSHERLLIDELVLFEKIAFQYLVFLGICRMGRLNRRGFRNAKVDFKELKMVAVWNCMGGQPLFLDHLFWGEWNKVSEKNLTVKDISSPESLISVLAPDLLFFVNAIVSCSHFMSSHQYHFFGFLNPPSF